MLYLELKTTALYDQHVCSPQCSLDISYGTIWENLIFDLGWSPLSFPVSLIKYYYSEQKLDDKGKKKTTHKLSRHFHIPEATQGR